MSCGSVQLKSSNSTAYLYRLNNLITYTEAENRAMAVLKPLLSLGSFLPIYSNQTP